jgi:integrase
MAKKKTSRVYWRDQGGVRRAYIDLRDLGGGREALKVNGEKRGTTDADIAAELAARRVKELETQKRRKVILGVERVEGLKSFAAQHLLQKAKGGKVTTQWLEAVEFYLQGAISFFGPDRDVASISTADIQRFANHLQAIPNGRGGTISTGSQRHYLNSLSNLFRRAQSEGVVPPGYNPVGALMEKPSGKPAEASWLEPHEAALLLERARTYQLGPSNHLAGPIYPLLATMLLTGGRTSEVLGLEVDDVSFQKQTITFRPNEWRRLKTLTSHRSVPLWPQLEDILRLYFADGERAGGLSRLLLPSPALPSDSLITDFRKALDAVAMRAGWNKGEIRSKMFRHTYCSARLQTLDGGAPVSPFTVGKELGHGGTSMVQRVYSHLGKVRHRSDVVEYRVENHREALGERLTALETLTT